MIPKSSEKKSLWTMILYMLMSIPSFVIMHKSCNRENENSSLNNISTEFFKEQFKKIEDRAEENRNHYQIHSRKLAQRNDSLERVLNRTTRQLSITRKLAEESELSLREITGLYRNDTSVATKRLIHASENFLHYSNKRDSLCEMSNMQFSQVILVKDSLLVLCDAAYNSLSNDFSLLSDQHTALTRSIEKAQKEISHQRRKAKVFSSGIIALCGAIITLIIVNR